MKRFLPFTLPLLMLMGLIACEESDSNMELDAEDAILKLIADDDSTYGIDGMENVENEDFTLGKSLMSAASNLTHHMPAMRDSNFVWRFGRTGMNVERDVLVEVEDDTSAIALITHHITGTFHVKQFERFWLDTETWERGDSIRFSEKPIDMTAHRRVSFKKRISPLGGERWKPIAMTLQTGTSGSALEIETLEWVAEDSTVILSDFENVFYSRRDPLLLSQLGANHMNIMVSNDVTGEAEFVKGRFGYHPRMGRPDARSRFYFQYVETMENGDKRYTKDIAPVRHHRRHFKGFIDVLDFRTLFDHDYLEYSSATIGFVYTTRQRVQP